MHLKITILWKKMLSNYSRIVKCRQQFVVQCSLRVREDCSYEKIYVLLRFCPERS